ncbi:hypothetical protein ACRU43_16940 [Mycobacterium colombiense]
MNVDRAYHWLGASTPLDGFNDPDEDDDDLLDDLFDEDDIDDDPDDSPSDDDFDVPDDDLTDAGDVADDDEDRGYCPLCGNEHERPDDDSFCAPDEYTLAGCDGSEFEYRPFGHPDFEFR